MIILFSLIGLLFFTQTAVAQDKTSQDTMLVANAVATVDSVAVADSALAENLVLEDPEADVLGLAFCIERIIYLTLSEIKARKLMEDIEQHLKNDDVEGAKTLCRNTRGPVASVCYQGLLHIDQPIEAIERSITNYGGLQATNLEKGCSWIKLFIAMAPSLGFLGTVIGMVMAFDQIQQAGDIGPTIVAEGMKVALITTIFGIVVALILQLFYSYIEGGTDHHDLRYRGSLDPAALL